MPFFAAGLRVDRLDVPDMPGYWVELKRESTFDDDIAIQKAILRFDVQASEPEGASMTGDVDVGSSSLAYILRLLVAWNLDGPDGEIVPVSEQWVRALPGPVGQWLLREAVLRTRKRSEEEERPFDTRSPQPSTGTRLTTRTP